METQALIDELEAVGTEAQRVWDSLTPEQRLARIDPATWSVAQCLAHLVQTDDLVLPRMRSAAEEARKAAIPASGAPAYSLSERWIIRLMSPNPPMHLPVPPSFRPPDDPATLAHALDRLRGLHAEFRAVMRLVVGIDTMRQVVVSPVNKRFRMRLGAYMEAGVMHEKYHVQQAAAVADRVRREAGAAHSTA